MPCGLLVAIHNEYKDGWCCNAPLPRAPTVEAMEQATKHMNIIGQPLLRMHVALHCEMFGI